MTLEVLRQMMLVAGLNPNRAVAESIRRQSCFWGPWLGNLPPGQRPNFSKWPSSVLGSTGVSQSPTGSSKL